MGIELPGWLTEPLSWITLEWPQADETKLFEAGQVWMNFGMAAIPIGTTATSAAENVWTINEGPQVDAFQEWWNNDEGPAQRLTEDGIGAMLIGAALLLFGAITLALKIAWIVSLIILAVQVAMAIAASFATFGAASASIPGFIAVCRQVCIRLLRKVIDDVIKKGIKQLLDKAKKLFKKVAEKRAARRLADTNKIMDQITDALRRVNPRYNTHKAYNTNCTHCVQAYELRRRGIDAQATALPQRFLNSNGRPLQDISNVWGRQFTNAGGRTDIENAFSQPGSRGIVGLRWPDPNNPGTTNGGHVFNVENVNGRVHFIDAQNNRIDASDYFNRGVNPVYMRTDDLPTPNMHNVWPEFAGGPH